MKGKGRLMKPQDNTRIIISLPRYLLSAVDEGAKQRILSRSGYIRQILLEAVSQQEKVMDEAYEAGRRRKLKRYIDKATRDIT